MWSWINIPWNFAFSWVWTLKLTSQIVFGFCFVFNVFFVFGWLGFFSYFVQFLLYCLFIVVFFFLFARTLWEWKIFSFPSSKKKKKAKMWKKNTDRKVKSISRNRSYVIISTSLSDLSRRQISFQTKLNDT